MSTSRHYVNRLQGQLKEWQAEIDALERDATHSRSPTDAGLHRRMADLHEKFEAAGQIVAEMRASEGVARQGLREAADCLWEGLRRLVAEMGTTFHVNREGDA